MPLQFTYTTAFLVGAVSECVLSPWALVRKRRKHNMLVSVLSLLLTSACLMPSVSEAYQYSSNFINQVTTYPNIVTAKNRCLPGRSSGSGATPQTLLVCDPHELLSVDQSGPSLLPPREVPFLNQP
ncbi:unnamed protein product [Hydatigera taeniaeformis]|uniref:Secreted protein n=1 Tax=Hydatigena taeniaeformis TaxID=6205 RepID=A0A0R3X6W1_HYDTA|nr:unnamed protein product [Hydatigera taeniaeformis]